MKKYIIGSLSAFALIALCIAINSIIHKADPKPVEKELSPDELYITKEQALEDCEYMWEVLDENFPFFGVGERRDVFTYEVRKERLFEDVSRQGSMVSVEWLLSCINRNLYNPANLGHLNMIDPYSYYTVYKKAYDMKNDDDGQKISWLNTINDKVESTYSFFGQGLRFTSCKCYVI